MTYESPHEQCAALDAKGEAYWLRLFSWMPDERQPGVAINVTSEGDVDIVSHGPEWVRLCAQTTEGRRTHSVYIWKRWQDLGSFRICVEGD